MAETFAFNADIQQLMSFWANSSMQTVEYDRPVTYYPCKHLLFSEAVGL